MTPGRRCHCGLMALAATIDERHDRGLHSAEGCNGPFLHSRDATLRDTILAVVKAHPDGTDRSAGDGCYCGDTTQPYDDHLADLIRDAVAERVNATAICGAWHDAGWYARADANWAILDALALDASDALLGSS